MICAPCLAAMLAADAPNLHQLKVWGMTGRPPPGTTCPCPDCTRKLLRGADDYGGGSAGGAGFPSGTPDSAGDSGSTDWGSILKGLGEQAQKYGPDALKLLGQLGGAPSPGQSQNPPNSGPPPVQPSAPEDTSHIIWIVAFFVLLFVLVMRNKKK